MVGEKRRQKIADMADSTAILTFRNKQPSRSDKMNPTEKEKEHWANKLLHTSGIGIGHGTGRVYPRYVYQTDFYKEKIKEFLLISAN